MVRRGWRCARGRWWARRGLSRIAAPAGDGEPRLAVRAGQVLVPRLARADQQDVLAVPPGSEWRLEAAERGTLEGLAAVTTGDEGGALAAGQGRGGGCGGGGDFLEGL